MPSPVKIDFVSDVSCPWCAIGLRELETALERIGDTVDVEVRFQPFELDPDAPKEGQSIVERLTGKYGSTPAQVAANREQIRARAATLGFPMAMSPEGRLYNTFDAHRLLHWAGLEGRQHELKRALLEAYHSEDQSPADHEVLIAAAQTAGLDPEAARDILSSNQFEAEVRQAEYLWQSRGVTGVPSLIINERYLISGAQPSEAIEQALREIAAEAA